MGGHGGSCWMNYNNRIKLKKGKNPKGGTGFLMKIKKRRKK